MTKIKFEPSKKLSGPLADMWEAAHEELEARGAAGMPTRQELLPMLAKLTTFSEIKFGQVLAMLPTETDCRMLSCWRLWAKNGYQSVQMPATYAAGLMVTDARNVLAGVHLPWPAFEIQVPAGLLESGHGPIDSIWVCMIPESQQGRDATGRAHTLCVGYQDTKSWGTRTYAQFEALSAKNEGNEWEAIPAGLLAKGFSIEKEERAWNLIERLIVGVVLTITEERIDKPTAYPARPVRLKRGIPRRNTVMVGRPLEIDCRPDIARYLGGTGTTRDITASTIVRGHYRQQAYGPKWSLHRRTWIMPHRRGEGPLVMRPVHLGGKPDKNLDT